MEHRNQTGIVGISLRVVPKYHKVQYDKDEGGEQPKITNKELLVIRFIVSLPLVGTTNCTVQLFSTTLR